MSAIPVAFRIDTKAPFEVVAVFVSRRTNPTDSPDTRVCYAHIGQHSECNLAWVFENTRPATFVEYRDLMRELRGIYDDGDRIKIVKRIRR